MPRLVLFIALLTSPAITLRDVEQEASVETQSEQLCCAWRVQLGKMTCERDVYNENRCKPGSSKWDLSAAMGMCAGLQKGKKYFLASFIPVNIYLGSQDSLMENCVCEKYKGPGKGGGIAKRYPTGATSCQSAGDLGITHCKLNGQPVYACTCMPTNMACSSEDMSMLFAPQVKEKGMMFKCRGWFDKNTASFHYMSAFKAMGMVSDDAKPVQKNIGNDAGEGWTFKDKYGGQSLAATGFCGAESEEPQMPAVAPEDQPADLDEDTSSATGPSTGETTSSELP